MDILRNLRTESVEYAAPAPPLCVEPQTTVREVFRQLKEHRAGSVLVCRDGVLAGIFTERDAVGIMARGGQVDGRNVFDLPIEQVMVPGPVSISAQATVGKAIVKMSAGGYRRLPIVDDAGHPVGVVQIPGIVHYLAEHFPKTVYNQPPVANPVTQQREGS